MISPPIIVCSWLMNDLRIEDYAEKGQSLLQIVMNTLTVAKKAAVLAEQPL